MSQLQDNLNEIKRQKDTYIIPENIKKDVTVLGVTGTLESGGSTINNQDKTVTVNGVYTADSGYTGLGTVTVNVPQEGEIPVKLFDTVEHMQQDPTAQEGDLALVYRESLTGVTGDTEFDSCTFPETVVLSEAFTSSVYGSFRAVDQSVMFDGMVDLSSSSFRFDGYGDSTQIQIEYTSSDGITYTRTDGGDPKVEFGTIVKYESYGDPFPEVLGNFMKVGGNYFDGLYKYELQQIEETGYQLFSTDVDDYNWDVTTSGDPVYMYYSQIAKYDKIYCTNALGDRIASLVESLTTGMSPFIFINAEKTILTICDTNTQTLYKRNDVLKISNNGTDPMPCYSVNIETGEHTSFTITYNETDTSTNYTLASLPVNCDYILGTVHTRSDGKGTCYLSGGNIWTNWTLGDTQYLNKSDRYVICPTQLTLNNPNQLLPGLIGYGKSGIVTGDNSIYNNLDNEKLLKTVTDIPFLGKGGATDDSSSSYYGRNTKLCDTISGFKSDTMVQLVETDKMDNDIDYIVGVNEYYIQNTDIHNLVGYNAYYCIVVLDDYIICTCRESDSGTPKGHLLKLDKNLTQVLEDIPLGKGQPGLYGNKYGALVNCVSYDSSLKKDTYIMYCISKDGDITGPYTDYNPAYDTIYITPDSYIFFNYQNDVNKCYLFDPVRKNIKYVGPTRISGTSSTLWDYNMLNFDNELYLTTTVYQYSNSKKTKSIYRYDKTTGTLSTVKTYTGDNGGSISRGESYIRSHIKYSGEAIIKDSYLIDWVNGGIYNIGSSDTHNVYPFFSYINSEKTIYVTEYRGDNLVLCSDNCIYQFDTPVTLGDIELETDQALARRGARRAVITSNLTKVAVNRDKGEFSTKVLSEPDDYNPANPEVDATVVHTDHNVYTIDAAWTIQTMDSVSFDTSNVACKYKWHYFKLASKTNTPPTYMLMKTSFHTGSNAPNLTQLVKYATKDMWGV